MLADGAGDVVHLYERDCSVQRRHQKVVEIAPAPNLDLAIRERLWADAVTFARAVGYLNAGTVEFLVAPDGRYVFIEMNPRIQVEHTVTEEVTAIDIVQAQLQVAAGATLADLGIAQAGIEVTGTALQCRITTEDPAHELPTGYRPGNDLPFPGRLRRAAGRLHVRRGGRFPALRLPPGQAHVPGADLSRAVARARRAVAEFRVRGVATNIPFLQAVLEDPDFMAGNLSTSFIDERPALMSRRSGADRGTRLLTYVADVTVNRPHGPAPNVGDPREKLPQLPALAGPAVAAVTTTWCPGAVNSSTSSAPLASPVPSPAIGGGRN